MIRFVTLLLLALGMALPVSAQSAFDQQNAVLFEQLQRVHGLSNAQMAAIKEIFARSGYIGRATPPLPATR